MQFNWKRNAVGDEGNIRWNEKRCRICGSKYKEPLQNDEILN
jgi:hypothetical protein